MRVIILGAPGAGKGTQCKRIVDRYGVLHLSSGDILRQERAQGTEPGKKAQGYMDSGALVPDDIIVEMMACAMKKAGEKGFILDGFPRTVNQAEELDKAIAADNETIDTIINLDVSDELVKKRLTGRRSCPKCGAVYHIENMPPKEDMLCDNDKATLVQRPDDTPEVVQNRLDTYHQQTKPVIGYYRQNHTLCDIDANKDADQVTEEIFKILDNCV